MAKHKTEFGKSDRDLSKYASALAFPARLAIIRIVLKNEDWVPFSHFTSITLDNSAVEKHLKELAKAGLIELQTTTGILHAKIKKDNFYVLAKGFIDLLENDK